MFWIHDNLNLLLCKYAYTCVYAHVDTHMHMWTWIIGNPLPHDSSEILFFALCGSVTQVSLSLSQDAFSLLAYSDPWNCPVGQQLDPIQREPVCAALNSAILGKAMHGDPSQT